MLRQNKAGYIIDNSVKINIFYTDKDDLKTKLDYLCNSMVINYLKKCIRNKCRAAGYKVNEIKDLSLLGIDFVPLMSIDENNYLKFLFFWFRYVSPKNGECERISYCCNDTDFDNKDINNKKLDWREIK